MKVLVTGATGYVGSRLCAKLVARGHQVEGVVRTAARAAALPSGVAPVVADLAEVDKLVHSASRSDAVVHTGFVTHGTDWFAAVEVERSLVNAWSTALAGSSVRLVVSNGTGFLGDSGGRFLDETAPVPDDHPARVRAEATRAATATAGLQGIELRLASFVYGDGGSVFLPPMIAAARRSGESLYVGDGNNRLSSVHVDAAAQAYVDALETKDARGIYVIASDEAPPMRELAAAIAVGVGNGCRPVSVSVAEAGARLDPFTAMFVAMDNGLDSRRARCDLGWLPAGRPSLLWDVAYGSYATER